MRFIVFAIISLSICACSCSKDINREIDQDFISDLASENNRVAGDLYFEYNSDLSNLTYDSYLTFITKNEKPSSIGFSKKVKNADYHYFVSNKNAFVIALYYINERTMLCDNSNTSFLDSVKVVGVNDSIPGLSKVASRFINK
ncbi:MAG: hypothetical protein K9J16_07980 [Melioribacteraceae bacterium]|nr:hypothetical protein [Melioribacteraceae bacterium]MCF8353839.1 hypothetical protein [Melioribacteraceae bacterium]MCF8393072.1 hypothetical protein [Melioribacteraceae bacterium]MCF8419191.1 hypothetical protein [Melioribacteraceae bacterium]